MDESEWMDVGGGDVCGDDDDAGRSGYVSLVMFGVVDVVSVYYVVGDRG